MNPRTVNQNAEVSAMSIQQNPAQNRVSFRDLLALFCCPPFPSAIVSKLAFMPPTPSYRIEYDPETNEPQMYLLGSRAEFPHGREEFRKIDIFHTKTRRNNKIACMFIPRENARYTILHSHGNAVDLGQMCSFYYVFGLRLGVNVFAYDYSGYGCSTGHPTEKNIYADIAAALGALKSRYNIKDEQVILYGQSIGTVPSVDLASNNPNIAALILHSPLLSALRVACSGVKRTWCCDAFPSVDKIHQVQCPTLVIHGTDDDVIDFHHGHTIHKNCPTKVEPLWIPGAGHNDIELHTEYLRRLRVFINYEIRSNGTASTNSTTVSNGTRG